MQSQLIGKVPALSNLNGVDFTDEISYRGVRRRQLFAIADISVRPCERVLSPFS